MHEQQGFSPPVGPATKSWEGFSFSNAILLACPPKKKLTFWVSLTLCKGLTSKTLQNTGQSKISNGTGLAIMKLNFKTDRHDYK